MLTYTTHGQSIACVAFRSTGWVGVLDMECAIQLRLVSFRATYAPINILGSCGLRAVVRVFLRSAPFLFTCSPSKIVGTDVSGTSQCQI